MGSLNVGSYVSNKYPRASGGRCTETSIPRLGGDGQRRGARDLFSMRGFGVPRTGLATQRFQTQCTFEHFPEAP